MTLRAFLGVTSILGLAACQPTPVTAPSTTDLTAEIVRLTEPGPPKGPDGACWASDVTPAVIETVTEQVLLSPEKRDDQGNITAPATFRTVTQQRMIQDNEEVWFRSPCPDQLTIDFIATLQRALKARGLYVLDLSGVMDAATLEAVRRYQAERGLDSPVLSLAATRALGIVPTALADL